MSKPDKHVTIDIDKLRADEMAANGGILEDHLKQRQDHFAEQQAKQAAIKEKLKPRDDQ